MTFSPAFLKINSYIYRSLEAGNAAYHVLHTYTILWPAVIPNTLPLNWLSILPHIISLLVLVCSSENLLHATNTRARAVSFNWIRIVTCTHPYLYQVWDKTTSVQETHENSIVAIYTDIRKVLEELHVYVCQANKLPSFVLTINQCRKQTVRCPHWFGLIWFILAIFFSFLVVPKCANS